MDLNSNMNKRLNNSGSFNSMPLHQTMASPTLTPEQLMSLQQMQLNAQMGNLTLNGLQSSMYQNQNMPSPYVFPSMPDLSSSSSGYHFMTGVLPISPTTQMPMMSFPQATTNGSVPQTTMTGQSFQPFDATQQIALLLQLQNNIPSAVDLRKTVKERYQQFEYPPEDESEHSPQSPEVLTPLTGSSPSLPITSTRRHLILSETSSTTSSGPTSPSSAIGFPLSSLSDYSPGPNSPKSPVLNRQLSEPQKQNPSASKLPIRNSSLKYDTKYPQDKCYRCMQKVYPVEKIGPIKEVVYHKGCFTCKTCGTKLNLTNFFHCKNDDWDIHVYCKSHHDQGVPQPHIDANSVLIKGAMAVPKLEKVNEQIRGNDETHKGGKLDANAVTIRTALSAPKKEDQTKIGNSRYHLDLQSLGIAHARNVPATDLQTGNKIKQQSWTKEDRKSESVPPPDVVKYSDVVPEYDMESYNRHQVESNPDYDRW